MRDARQMGTATPTATIDTAPTVAMSAVAPATSALAGWETRLASGLAVPGVPTEARSPLVGALGMAGVEAEYLLALARSLHTNTASPAQARTRGEAFLTALEAVGHRLIATARRVELAVQTYLAALAASHADVRAQAEVAPPWWGPADAALWSGVAVEADLRRHGFSLRQVAGARLGETVEALSERMALTLHALATLPPAGVLPVAALAAGIYQLAELWQDDIADHLVRDLTPTYPGLLTAIARLRAEDASMGSSLDDDLTWAREQCAAAQAVAVQQNQRVEGSMVTAAERAAMVNESVRAWQETVTLLERLCAGER